MFSCLYLQGSLGETLKEVRHYIFVFISPGISRRDVEGSETQGRRNEKKARGAENFKKAHCNYFELKPGFIDAQ